MKKSPVCVCAAVVSSVSVGRRSERKVKRLMSTEINKH